jgi:hypothetical protein
MKVRYRTLVEKFDDDEDFVNYEFLDADYCCKEMKSNIEEQNFAPFDLDGCPFVLQLDVYRYPRINFCPFCGEKVNCEEGEKKRVVRKYVPVEKVIKTIQLVEEYEDIE